MPQNIAAVLRLLSVVVYVASFVLPVCGESKPVGSCLGIGAFLMALFWPWALAIGNFPEGLIYVMLWFPSWLANVAYWLALFCLSDGKNRKATLLAGLGVFLGLTIIPGLGFWGGEFRVGYWCWIGSMALLALAAGIAGESRWVKPKGVEELS